MVIGFFEFTTFDTADKWLMSVLLEILNRILLQYFLFIVKLWDMHNTALPTSAFFLNYKNSVFFPIIAHRHPFISVILLSLHYSTQTQIAAKTAFQLINRHAPHCFQLSRILLQQIMLRKNFSFFHFFVTLQLLINKSKF